MTRIIVNPGKPTEWWVVGKTRTEAEAALAHASKKNKCPTRPAIVVADR